MRTSPRTLVALIVILLLAVAARLYGIQAQSLWFDEGWSAYAATQPTLIDAAHADATNPPLYYVLLNIHATFIGSSEFGLRLFSLFCGLLVVALVFRLGSRLFGEHAALYAALLVAASPLLWWASQEARMYSLLAALVLVCALAWHRLYHRPTRRMWLVLWLAELALLYAHNTGPVVALWLNAVTVIAWIAAGRIDRRLTWKWWIGGQLLIGLLWLPYFLTRFITLGEANSAVTSTLELTPVFGLNLWRALWQTPWERVLLSGEPAALSIGLLVAFGLLVPWSRPAARWLVLHALVLTAGLLIALAALGNEIHGRYLVMIVPLLLVPLGAGIARLRPQIIRLALAAGVVAVFLANLIYAQTSDYRHDDARAMVQYYADRLTATDSVLAWSYADRYELAYYWDNLDVAAGRITLPEGAELETVLPLLPDSGDVALNVWYTQRADYRRMLPCLLSNGTINEPEQHTVYGMSSLLYRSPSLSLPELAAADITFVDGVTPIIQVTNAGQIAPLTPDRAQCLPIVVTLARETEVELKAALIVQNELGWEIARADAVLATANQRASENVPPGTALAAYPLLRLPVGTPPGEYRIFLRIYDESESPSGYAPPMTIRTSGRDALLGVWDAPAGARWDQVSRAAALPVTINIQSGDLTLLGHNAAGDVTLTNGSEIRLTLLWQGQGELPPLTLADSEGRWSVGIPAAEADEALTRDWRSVRVPADAPDGSAELRLPDGTVLNQYAIESLPLLLESPAFDVEVGATFPGAGELVGYRLNQPIRLDTAPALTLVWRGGEIPAAVSYTVFAQLVNADGRVIAQSDSVPAAGARPTTGWRAGEYIEDSHQLQYNDLAAPGRVSLIVGLYNAVSGQRLLLDEGRDFVALAEGLEAR